MDIIDRAQECVDQDLRRAIDKARADHELCGDGICCDCERPIPEGRLQALPGAMRCVACQAAHEMELARRRQ